MHVCLLVLTIHETILLHNWKSKNMYNGEGVKVVIRWATVQQASMIGIPPSLRAGVCSWCGKSLAGVVPFERLQYKYCTMNCLKEHRTQLTK